MIENLVQGRRRQKHRRFEQLAETAPVSELLQEMESGVLS